MTDDVSISFACDLCMGFRCDNNLSSILQYAMKSKETRSKKFFEFNKGVEITIKSKETSS